MMDPYVPLPPLPARIARLNELAYDLWWSWNAEAREVFRDLDYPLWRFTDHNPVLLLHLVEPERLRLFTDFRYARKAGALEGVEQRGRHLRCRPQGRCYPAGMPIVVQKYGGTSVGTPERIQHVADRVAGLRLRGVRPRGARLAALRRHRRRVRRLPGEADQRAGADAGGLRRREEAAQDAAQDDHRQQAGTRLSTNAFKYLQTIDLR